MKVILYIGHHKIGSTSLQTFLSQNSNRLLENGILYPYVERQGALIAGAKRLFGDRLGAGPINVREAHNALAFRLMSESPKQRPVPKYHRHIPPSAKIFKTIQAQIARHDPQVLILCAEVFSNFGTVAPEQIDRLRDAFPAATFEIYLGLRRPDEHIIAWQSQQLAFGNISKQLSDPNYHFGFRSIHFSFSTLLAPWLARFPDTKLILRPYSDILLSGGSSLDFMENVGADFPEDLRPAPKSNPSLPNAMMEIARRANAQLTPGMAKSVRRCLHRAARNITVPKNADVEMFGPENRDFILKYFMPTHTYLSDLIGSTSFFPDYDEVGRCKPIPEIEALQTVLAQLDKNLLINLGTKGAAAFILDRRTQLRVHEGVALDREVPKNDAAEERRAVGGRKQDGFVRTVYDQLIEV